MILKVQFYSRVMSKSNFLETSGLLLHADLHTVYGKPNGAKFRATTHSTNFFQEILIKLTKSDHVQRIFFQGHGISKSSSTTGSSQFNNFQFNAQRVLRQAQEMNFPFFQRKVFLSFRESFYVDPIFPSYSRTQPFKVKLQLLSRST